MRFRIAVKVEQCEFWVNGPPTRVVTIMHFGQAVTVEHEMVFNDCMPLVLGIDLI